MDDDGPIVIRNNSDFENQAASNGWEGNGSPNDPYVIEDLHLDVKGGYESIFIYGTDCHFLIRNISSSNYSDFNNRMIRIAYAENGIVKDISSDGFMWGIDITQCSNISVVNCTFSVNRNGLFLYQSENITIDGCDFTGNENGLVLQDSNRCFIIGCSFEFNGYGVYLTGNEHVLKDNHFYWDDYGIFFFSSQNRFYGNLLIGCGFVPYYFTHEIMRPIIPANNTVNGKGVLVMSDVDHHGGSIDPGYGQMILINVTNFNIEACSVNDTSIALYIIGCENVDIFDVDLSGNYHGIEMISTENYTIKNCRISDSRGAGLVPTGSNEGLIDGNIISGSMREGMALVSSEYVEVVNNTMRSSGDDGIYLHGSNQCTVHDNIIENGSGSGISLFFSDRNHIYRNSIRNNSFGGFFVQECSYNVYRNNSIRDGRYGFFLWSSFGYGILNNSIRNCSYHGVMITQSFGGSLKGNAMIGCGIYLKLFESSYLDNHEISTSNSVNGKPIYYYSSGDQFGAAVPEDAGQVIVGNAYNLEIRNITFSDMDIAVQIRSSSNIDMINCGIDNCRISGVEITESELIEVRENKFTTNGIGIMVTDYYPPKKGVKIIRGNTINGTSEEALVIEKASNVEVVENSISNGSDDGIYIYSSSDVLIKDNIVEENMGNGLVLADCSVFNSVMSNRIIGSGNNGILIAGSSSSQRVYENVLQNNVLYGVKIEGTSDDNRIFHNIFLENNGAGEHFSPDNVQACDEGGSNTWYSSGSHGNFWGDWLIPDDDFNGIVDLEYGLDGANNSDPYPLTTVPEVFLPPPYILLCMGYGNRVELKWRIEDPDPIMEIEELIVFREDDKGEFIVTAVLNPEIRNSTDHDVEPNREYRYRMASATEDFIGMHSGVMSVWTDGIPPVIDIKYPANGSYHNKRDIVVKWSSHDPHSGVKSVEISMDGSPFISKAAADEQVFENLSEGPHLLSFRLEDHVENAVTEETIFTVDVTKPIVEIITPINGSFLNDTCPIVEWEAYDDTTGIEMVSMMIDDESWIEYGNATSANLPELNEGPHTMKIMAVDYASNIAYSGVDLIIDQTPPIMRIISPMDGSYAIHSTVGIEVIFNDALSGIKNVSYRLNGGSWQDFNLNRTKLSLKLDDGEYEMEFIAMDLAGNTVNSSVRFIVDTKAPGISSYYPMDQNVSLDTEITVEFDEEVNNALTVMFVQIINGVQTWNGNKLTFTPVDPLEYGSEVEVRIEATDRAGNAMVPYTWSFMTVERGIVTGRVVAQDGSPLSGVNVLIDGFFSRKTETDGLFSIDLGEGSYKLTLRMDGYKDHSTNVTIADGKTSDLGDLELERDPSESGSGGSGVLLLIIILVIALILIMISAILVITVLRKKSQPAEESDHFDDIFDEGSVLMERAEHAGLDVSRISDSYNTAVYLRDIGEIDGAVKVMESVIFLLSARFEE